ncbi:MAG: 5-deoxy-glucuronate isomerase, partial [Deltaproteobacteria bacterium]|nr:5-deoxy-glucuronate isomerase [Deltaproteobacteria bacterium]
MNNLLRKPSGTTGKIVDITPEDAGWRYVGFAVYALKAGGTAGEATGEREVILVMVEGKARLATPEVDFGVQGERMNVFEQTRPYAVYVPNGTSWSAHAETDCTIAVCSAPGAGGHPARAIDPESIPVLERGKGANTRYVHPIAMDDADIADSLLITEVYTPQGNWSSSPPHRHDSDEGSDMTYLEETYYHRINPPQGFGFQRVFTEDGELDETMAVSTAVPFLGRRGLIPAGAP